MCKLSWCITIHFVAIYSWNVHCCQKSRKFTENVYLRIQGRPRLSMLILLRSLLPVLVITKNRFVSICNRFHARRANSVIITSFTGCLYLTPSSERNSLPQWHKICQEILETLSYHMLKTRSLYLNCAWTGTGICDRHQVGQTDRQNFHS